MEPSPAETPSAERISPGPAGQRERAGCDLAFSSLSFPQKLWEVLESDQFRSIWWSQAGKCVAINKDLFQVEVLGRAAPQRVFAMQKLKSFIRQLNFYGFTKMPEDVERSSSLPEFLAEEAAASAHSQVQPLLCTSTNAHGGLGAEMDLPINRGCATEEMGMVVSGRG